MASSPDTPSPLKTVFYLVAGEPSGDVLGARLMMALTAEAAARGLPPPGFAGIGGPAMTAAGLQSLFPMEELSVMGFAEVLPRARRLLARLDQTADAITALSPAAVITIDSPGFAMRLAKRLRARRGDGLCLVHYVAPQIWAWRKGRLKEIAALFDHLLALLPFEPPIFEAAGLGCTFVGHPVLESGFALGDGATFRRCHGISPTAPLLLLLPGSRHSEIKRLLPVFRRTLDHLCSIMPDLVAVLITVPATADKIALACRDWPSPLLLVMGDKTDDKTGDDKTGGDEKRDAFAAANVALAASGTVTLELALAGVPMVVGYRIHPLTAVLVRRLLRVPYVTLINLMAGRAVIPELLQENCTPRRLVAALRPLFGEGGGQSPAARAQQAAFADSLRQLTPPDGTPSLAAARQVWTLLASRKEGKNGRR